MYENKYISYDQWRILILCSKFQQLFKKSVKKHYFLPNVDCKAVFAKCVSHTGTCRIQFREFISTLSVEKVKRIVEPSAMFKCINSVQNASYKKGSLNDNIYIYLKSGIPAAVLMPAPVCTTTWLASFISLAKAFIFSSNLDGSSWIWNNIEFIRVVQTNNYLKILKRKMHE